MKNQSPILRIFLGLLLLVTTYLTSYSRTLPYVTDPPPSITNITICNNQLPFHWNALTCLMAGTYTAVLTGSNGADSTAILNLSVINIGSSITNAVICDNQLPYQWNGNSYTGSGTYSVTLTSSTGCDSVPILSLTVNHVVTSNTNANICSNQLPYSWNGHSYSAAGNYNVTLSSTAGCDSIANLHLLVRAVSSSSTNKTVCSNHLPYFWNGHSYSAAGTYSVTLTASNGCDSVATLHLFTTPVSTSFTPVTICTSQLPYSWNGQSFTTAGNHSVIFPAASGCDSIATLVLTIKPVLQSTTTITICNGQLPYTWNGNSYPSAGNYSVTLTGSGGCDSIAQLHLIAVPVLTSTVSVTTCDSQLPYIWNGNNYTTAGTYTASFINSAGCDSVATLILNIDTFQLVNGDVIICQRELPYLWNGYLFTAFGTYPIDPPIAVDACHAISSFTVAEGIIPDYHVVAVCNNHLPYTWHGNNYDSAGTYSMVIHSTTACDTLATLVLSVNPAFSSTTNVNICSSQAPYAWNGHYYNISGTFVQTLNSSQGCDSIATLNLIISPIKTSTTNLVICTSQLPYSWNGHTYSNSGIYTITLSSSAGCDSIATLNLGVQPFLTSTTNISVCNSQLPYSWNGNTYTTAGSYQATMPSSGGCDSIATLNLLVSNLMTGDTVINICNTQLPYTWNGNVYAAAGTYAVSLISSGGCDSTATLHLVVNSMVSSNTTITVCNNQLPYDWNGNSYPVAGMYPVTLTSSGGCDSVATLNLVVTDILTSTTNVTICNAQLPYSWNGNSYSAPGTYSVTLTSPGGCDSVPILSLTTVPYFTSTTNISVCSNQLPYAWNGHGYNAAGIFSDTLHSSSGCDSIATLNLLIKPVLSSTTALATCANQLPFNWNGQSYNSAGDYSVTLTGSNGCDSVAELHLLVKPVSNSTTNVTVCSNQLPYAWNNNSYPAAGNYSVTLTNSLGCDSITNLNLHVKQVTFSVTNVAVCENQLPYTWNGQQFSTSGNHIVTITNAAGCDSVATLHLIVSTVSTSLTAASVCANQLPFVWNGQSYNTAGLHSITLTNVAGCDSTATLDLTINPIPTSLTHVTVCSNQLPYNWNGQQFDSTGAYSVTLVSSRNCDSIAKLEFRVNQISNSHTTASICSSQLPYNWNGHSYTTAGIHTVTLVNWLGCDSTATLDLSIQQSPSAPIVTSPVVYCQYDSTRELVASITEPLAHLVWYQAAYNGTGSTIAPVPSTVAPGIINYYVSQVNGQCEGPRVPITITVNSKPQLGPDKALKICFGAMANLAALYSTSGLNAAWSYAGSSITNPTAIQFAGIYQLIVNSSAGCKDTAVATLTIQPPVVADAGPDGNAEPNIPYQLHGTGGGSYEWSPAGLLDNSFIASPLATINSDTRFILTVKDEMGCKASDTMKLRVLNGPTFYVPTAFTPNGDGLNDIFRPTPVGIASIDFFRIFNRYGELVYETHDPGQGWDGTYRGVKQNAGNYVWWIRGTDRKGEAKLLKGNVVLIR